MDSHVSETASNRTIAAGTTSAEAVGEGPSNDCSEVAATVAMVNLSLVDDQYKATHDKVMSLLRTCIDRLDESTWCTRPNNLDPKQHLDMLVAELKGLSLAQTDCMRAISLLQSFISDDLKAQSTTDDDKSAFLDDFICKLRDSRAKIKVLNDVLGCTQFKLRNLSQRNSSEQNHQGSLELPRERINLENDDAESENSVNDEEENESNNEDEQQYDEDNHSENSDSEDEEQQKLVDNAAVMTTSQVVSE